MKQLLLVCRDDVQCKSPFFLRPSNTVADTFFPLCWGKGQKWGGALFMISQKMTNFLYQS